MSDMFHNATTLYSLSSFLKQEEISTNCYNTVCSRDTLITGQILRHSRVQGKCLCLSGPIVGT